MEIRSTYELDLAKDIRYRNPLELAKAVREQVESMPDQYYLFVDEIQMSDEVPNPYNPEGKAITFYDAVTCSRHFRFRLEVGASCSTASAG